ncbi:MAG: hypothetical protein ACOYBE_02360 [Blautia sp.]
MLHKLMDMQVFLYGMAVTGVLGTVGMLAVHLTYRRRLKNTGRLSNLKEKWLKLWKSRDRLMRRMNHWVWYPALVCVLLMGTALLASASLGMEEGISMRYLYAGIGIPLALLLLRQALDFSYKEDLMVDSLADYIEKARNKIQEIPAAAEDPGLQNEVVEQIARSIKESAATGSHFSKMLSPEEEQLMREIIREFMS